jgi:hypothetical protein
VLDRFFVVLAIILLFLVRFRPVKYGIEALDILYTLVKGWSVRASFWSSQRSGQTLVKLGQPWSLGRILSKFSKLLEMYPGLHFKGFWARWVLVGLETARSNLGQTLVNPSQTWSKSNLVKPWEMCPGPSFWEYLMWRGVVGSCWLGPGCPVLCADTRENPGGKNGVMTPRRIR